MSKDWKNIQIIECEAGDGSTITIFRQSSGRQERYVLGNGQEVTANADGSFSIPGANSVLSVESV
ncbi:MHC class I heavy chain [Salipiger mangrovisoli]|uniref:MHC class I heavy chain n=1 Tax=Salipiger mangrovisoli TaxID=2865933 RepID=A0ABR9X6L7_9RHOB|nr:MHC class I heavy chain [Salipiger mangrovisoli]MBE9639253.1 MHC class I heavy chain [Salipiger mangrovisoli]